MKKKNLLKFKKKLYDAYWVNYSYFTRKDEQDSIFKILTYIKRDKNKIKNIYHMNVSKYKYFD